MSTTRSRKNKGKNFQNWVRDLILAYFTNLMPDDVKSTTMGESGVDIFLSPRAREVFNYDVECKFDENKSIWNCWAQTTKNATKGVPLLFMKKNHHEPLAIMRATDLVALLKRVNVNNA